ncbi:MAG: TetR/AcrR family transcriptional regulator [Kofleriaceae bacterium]
MRVFAHIRNSHYVNHPGAPAMYRQVKTTPRKRPRQARSQATVDSILAATTRVLIRHGFDGLTTNAVAELAGVSIGSLYQYFPNKEALVAALIEHTVERWNAITLTELGRVAALPIAEAVRAMIELTIQFYSEQPALHRVLLEQVPRVGRLARIVELHEHTQQVTATLLASRKRELAIGDPEMAAFVLLSAIDAIVQRATLIKPERLRDPALLDETTAMVTRYLGV